jgi:DNA-binding ferritin-like protein
MLDLLQAMYIGFASEYAFLVKSQDFHWNTVSRLFYQDHLLLERIYTEVQEAIDPFAENIRKLDALVPAGFKKLNALSIVTDATDGLNSSQMLEQLLADSDRLADMFRDLFVQAEDAGEHGLSNFLADRQDAHRTHSWMLRSSLKAG